MTYDEFLKAIVDRSQERLGKMYHVSIEKVLKNNGEMKDTLCMRKEESAVEPMLYLNTYYDLYQEQMTLDDIMDEIMEVYKWNENSPVGWSHDLENFEGIKDRIIFKLINAEKNKELLSSAPHILYLDLAIVFYIYKQIKENTLTCMIRTEHIESWGITQEELYKIAKENTPMFLPSTITDMKEVMKEIAKEAMGASYTEEVMNDLLNMDNDKPPMYVLTNEKKVFGASCILYKDVLNDFSEQVESDLIILPSSIHEVLIIPVSGNENIPGLRENVKMINSTEVPKEDILSDEIYYFARKEHVLNLIENTEV